MGKPAARMGDMTVHGGSIVAGFPTVLIGGMPAARVGDMHVCPMLTPAPTPIPHVGGPVMPPGVVTVLIGGMPAACIGDMCTCTGPPDSIAPPGAPTVMIGMGGGGGGGAGLGGEGSGQVSADAGGGAGVAEGKANEDDAENHYLDVKFTDKGGFPISGVAFKVSKSGSEIAKGPLSGRLRQDSLESGSYDIELKAIVNAKWSAPDATMGEAMTLSAETSGIESGEPVTVKIYVRDFNTPDRVYKTLETEVSGDAVEVDWNFEVDEEYLEIQKDKEQSGGYSMPVYFFTVESDDAIARSGLLRYKDYIEIKLHDQEGNPMSGKAYRVIFPNGEIREGTLDGSGQAREEKVPPGQVRVSFDVKG